MVRFAPGTACDGQVFDRSNPGTACDGQVFDRTKDLCVGVGKEGGHVKKN